MQDNLIGINETRLDKLTLDVINYADRINKIFNQLQTLVDGTSSYFISQEGNEFRKKFGFQVEYFSTMNQNILSYASDFVNLKGKYNTKLNDIATDVITSNNNSNI